MKKILLLLFLLVGACKPVLNLKIDEDRGLQDCLKKSAKFIRAKRLLDSTLNMPDELVAPLVIREIRRFNRTDSKSKFEIRKLIFDLICNAGSYEDVLIYEALQNKSIFKNEDELINFAKSLTKVYEARINKSSVEIERLSFAYKLSEKNFINKCLYDGYENSFLKKCIDEDINIKDLDPRYIDINKQYEGESALHYCVKNGLREFMQILLEKNASANLEDSKNRRPIFYALELALKNPVESNSEKYLKCIELLINHGAEIQFESCLVNLFDYNNPTSSHKTVIEYACKFYKNLLNKHKYLANLTMPQLIFKQISWREILALALLSFALRYQLLNIINIKESWKVIKDFNLVNIGWMITLAKYGEFAPLLNTVVFPGITILTVLGTLRNIRSATRNISIITRRYTTYTKIQLKILDDLKKEIDDYLGNVRRDVIVLKNLISASDIVKKLTD